VADQTFKRTYRMLHSIGEGESHLDTAGLNAKDKDIRLKLTLQILDEDPEWNGVCGKTCPLKLSRFDNLELTRALSHVKGIDNQNRIRSFVYYFSQKVFRRAPAIQAKSPDFSL